MLRTPTPSDLEDDPDVDTLLDDLDDEYFLINDLEDDFDDAFEDDDDDSDEDVFDSISRRREGLWLDEE